MSDSAEVDSEEHNIYRDQVEDVLKKDQLKSINNSQELMRVDFYLFQQEVCNVKIWSKVHQRRKSIINVTYFKNRCT